MAINTSVQTFTTAELLALTNKAIADILVGGQAYNRQGQSLSRADLKNLLAAKAELETAAADEATDSGGGLALVAFGERA